MNQLLSTFEYTLRRDIFDYTIAIDLGTKIKLNFSDYDTLAYIFLANSYEVYVSELSPFFKRPPAAYHFTCIWPPYWRHIVLSK